MECECYAFELKCGFPFLIKIILQIFLFQSGKSYEELKKEFGDTASPVNVTVAVCKVLFISQTLFS